MRTTLNLDDELVKKSMELTGIKSKTELIHAGLKALNYATAAKYLIDIGGTMPDATFPDSDRVKRYREQKKNARRR